MSGPTIEESLTDGDETGSSGDHVPHALEAFTAEDRFVVGDARPGLPIGRRPDGRIVAVGPDGDETGTSSRYGPDPSARSLGKVKP